MQQKRSHMDSKKTEKEKLKEFNKDTTVTIQQTHVGIEKKI